MARKVPLITTHDIAICSCLLMIMAQYVALGQPVAKPGCPSRCGNITVPYPFGIGAAGCFLDKWFEIVCGNGTTPSLNGATDLVVTGISLDGTIRATRADWVENNTEQRRAFEGGPFELPGLVYAPMVIKWQLLNYTTFDVFGTSLVTNQTNSNSSRVYWDPQENAYRGGPQFVNSSCEFYNHTSSRLECSCPLGYEGNPYLINGCQDIDECDLTRNGTGRICTISGTECFNVGGGFLCTSMVRERASRVKPILIGIGCGLGALLMLIGSWGLYKLVKRRKEIQQKERFFKRNGGILLQQQLTHSDEVNVEKTKLYDSKELEKATDNFNASRILGQGGQGTVYKGMLVDGKIVAIKKSKILDEEKITEFINEVVILSQINHRNVVKLLGCCLETEVPLLVYEFIPNGTLSHYIHDPNEEVPLTWDLRLRIATEIAGALSYLHSSAAVPIYHRDIKSTNILLDEKFRAKVADFGTSRTISIDQTHLTTLVHGTFGYLDPEYFQSSQFTDKSDVYSFGVVLVELLSGQKPISKTRSNEDRSLATYFMLCMEENRLFDIVDPRIAKEGEKEAIVALATLARSCLNLNGRRRPTMREVATELERIQKSVQSSNGLQDFEVLEFVRDEVAEPEPFDLFASSVTWSDSRGDAGSSSGRPFLSHTGTMIDKN